MTTDPMTKEKWEEMNNQGRNAYTAHVLGLDHFIEHRYASTGDGMLRVLKELEHRGFAYEISCYMISVWPSSRMFSPCEVKHAGPNTLPYFIALAAVMAVEKMGSKQ